MKDNREMFYSDYQASGYISPYNNNMMNGMNPNFNNGFMPYNNQYMNNTDYNYYENRLLKLERQVKRLESRVTRLENLSGNSLDDITSTNETYMI